MTAGVIGMDTETLANHTQASADRLSPKLIENVDVRIETFLGATTITIATLRELKSGSVITLDAALNEVVELRLNGFAFAHGELVAVGDKFAVRITSVSA